MLLFEMVYFQTRIISEVFQSNFHLHSQNASITME